MNEFEQVRIKTINSILLKRYAEMSGIKILDIGCGDGHIVAEIKKLLPYSDIVAIDKSPDAVEFCRSEYKNIRFEQMDACKLTFEKDSFDAIVIANVFEHLMNLGIVIDNLNACLRPGGIVVVSTPNRFRLQNILRIMAGKSVSISKEHVTEYTIDQIREIFKFHGLLIEEKVFPRLSYSGKDFSWRLFYHTLTNIANFYLWLAGSDKNVNPIGFYILKKY